MGDVDTPKIALITGLEFEAALARKVNKDHGSEALVFLSGLGAPLAQKVVTDAKKAGAKGIISFGVCGGLDPALKAGSIALPEVILGQDTIAVEPAWRDRLHKRLADEFDITSGKILTVKHAVETTEKKADLYKQTGASVVDMESSILARHAAEHQLAFIAVRVVHDPAWQTVPKAMRNVIDDNGQISGWKLIKGLALNWPGFKTLKQMSDNDLQARTNLENLTRLALPDFALIG